MDFLTSIGVREADAEQASFLARLAIGRCKPAENSKSARALRDDAEKLAKGLRRAADLLFAASDDLWRVIENAHEENPPGQSTDPSSIAAMREKWRKRIGQRGQFVANVRLVADAATDATARLGKNGRPASTHANLFDQLGIIWARTTGKPPTASKDGTIENPRSAFGKFVRACLDDAGLRDEFQSGFGDRLVRARNTFVERNPKRGAKPARK